MPEISIEKRMGRRCLSVTDGGPEDHIGNRRNFRDKMLQFNEIDGVLRSSVRELNGREIYEYYLGEKDCLSDICEKKKADSVMIRTILTDALEIVIRAREYLLSEDDFLISPDTVFLGDNYKVSLPYYPGSGSELVEKLRGLAEFFLDKLDYGDEAAVMCVYSFYMKCKEQGVSAEALLEELRRPRVDKESTTLLSHSCSSKAGDPPKVESDRHDIHDGSPSHIEQDRFGGKQRYQASDNEPYSLGDIYHNSRPGMRIKSQLIAGAALLLPFLCIMFRFLGIEVYTHVIRAIASVGSVLLGVLGEVILWHPLIRRMRHTEDETPTVLMSDLAEEGGFSMVSDEYPTVRGTTFPFFIGRNQEGNDYALDYPGVSRRHIEITECEDVIYVTDLGSSNGTFVNHERLEPGVRTPIRRGDEIRIGPCLYYCN